MSQCCPSAGPSRAALSDSGASGLQADTSALPARRVLWGASPGGSRFMKKLTRLPLPATSGSVPNVFGFRRWQHARLGCAANAVVQHRKAREVPGTSGSSARVRPLPTREESESVKPKIARLGLGTSRLVFGSKLQPEYRPFADVAALLARRLNVPLRLVHVSEDARAASLLGTEEEYLLGPVRIELNAEAERLRTLSGAEVRGHLAGGNVSEALLSVASTELATVLLLRGEASGKSVLPGATVETVSRKSGVPVLVLREPERFLAWLRGERALRVLVCADLGRGSESARAFASAWCALGQVELDVAMVITPSEVQQRLCLSPAEREQSVVQHARAVLAGDLRNGAPAAEKGARIRVLMARGSPDAHLVTMAEQENFDLVVLGQCRRALPENLWYGSVARGVLRAAPVSVASIPLTVALNRPVFRPPGIVLVATDFSETSNGAVGRGAAMVTEGGTVHLAHVVVAGAASPDEARKVREEAWNSLSRLASAGEDGAARFERHVLEGAPTFELLALAERLSADLIVLGTRSRSVGPSARLGSVARSVSERARVPVLLVPGPSGS